MKQKKIKNVPEKNCFIKPLFFSTYDAYNKNLLVLPSCKDEYNKVVGKSLLNAKNDTEAIITFLQEYQDSPETLRSYTKEVERLLLWCFYAAKITISSLRRNHVVAYQDFLKDPAPKKIWCGASTSRLKKDGSLNSAWRPFIAGLSSTSINKTLRILDSFFNYLVQTHYLMGNPLAVDRRRKKRHQTKPRIVDRYLELDEIHAVLDALSHYAIHNETTSFQVVRARYIILLLVYTGLRIAEAAEHEMGNFLQRENNWFLRVIGKGKKIREIPVPDALLDALATFRLATGLSSPQPKFKEKTPLIPMKNLTEPISARRIDQILKWAFNLGAARLEAKYPRKASKLRSASAHWLRHSYVTYLLDSGAPLKVAQENAGHSDVSTTMLYYHLAQVDRHAATQKLSLVPVK